MNGDAKDHNNYAHGINTSRVAKSVTYVSGTFCYLCLGSLTQNLRDCAVARTSLINSN
jgi:hypothetical protein